MGMPYNGTKVKVAVMMENGDKLEYEAMLDKGVDLAAAKTEAEKRFGEAVATLGAKTGPVAADRVKIEAC
jgi:hypothetical protein